MKHTLKQSNVWLRESAQREVAMRRSAATSSAVEGIFKPFASPQEPSITAPPAKSAKSRD